MIFSFFSSGPSLCFTSRSLHLSSSSIPLCGCAGWRSLIASHFFLSLQTLHCCLCLDLFFISSQFCSVQGVFILFVLIFSLYLPPLIPPIYWYPLFVTFMRFPPTVPLVGAAISGGVSILPFFVLFVWEIGAELFTHCPPIP